MAKKSKDFITERLKGCNAYEVARAAGCSHQTVYNWVHSANGGGKFFASAIEEAIETLKNKEEDERSNGTESQPAETMAG